MSKSGGVFQRADDVTRTMPKGGGVLVNVQEWWCVRACECLHPPPPSGNPVSAPAILQHTCVDSVLEF